MEAKSFHSIEEEEFELPGYRFHPTDEELVGFYLPRLVDGKLFHFQLIRRIDVYKFDPWDLPKASLVGENEGYFFCKRERKYKNSVRPNRVTGSGFWKATGIDRAVYSLEGEGHECLGLKKTLVFYQGSAAKATKTDWMMHEYRLPHNTDNVTSIAHAETLSDPHEAEKWTLCRIFKRNALHKRYKPADQKRDRFILYASSSDNNRDSYEDHQDQYISFVQAPTTGLYERNVNHIHFNAINELLPGEMNQAPPTATSPSISNAEIDELYRQGKWGGLGQSVMGFGSEFSFPL